MINVIGPINQLGYGITCLNIVKFLNEITDVALWPISQPQVTNKEDFDLIQYCVDKAKLPDFNANCLRIWHQHDMSQFVGKGQRIGFPIFELDTFTKLEKHHLSSLDKIFVCSHWAKNVILNNLNFADNNVHVIPLGVDTNIFCPHQEPKTSGSDKTIFFNCGKWEIRKGHDILIDLFNQAFNQNDNVELWMMCENPFLSEEETAHWHSLYLKSKLGNKIKILPRLATQKEVYNIMQKVNCGIFPSRAEGWNLELLEMLACGKHVITTNYAAHQEFCNKENSYLVNITSKELAFDNKWFHGEGSWALIGKDEQAQFINYMRLFHQTRLGTDTPHINVHGVHTSQSFTWKHTARKILDHAI